MTVTRFALALTAGIAALSAAGAAQAGSLKDWGLRLEAAAQGDASAEKTVKGSLVRYGSNPLEDLAILKPDQIKVQSTTRDDAAVTRGPRGDTGVVVIQRNLKDLIEAAGTRNRMDVKVTRGVRGIVRDAYLPDDMTGMLEQLSHSYDLVWYRNGKTVHVSSASENNSRIIFLGNVSFQRFAESLADAGLGNAGFAVEYLPEAQSVSVSGPVSYLASAELIADALTKTTSSRSIMVIKGGQIAGSSLEKAGS